MKINRFLALAAIALLVVGAMGVIGTKAFAQSATPPAQSQECAQQDNDSVQAQNAPDTDNVDLQCGDQNGADSGQEAQEAESADGQDAAPTGTPAISAEAAQKSAEAYLNAGSAVKVELDDENGALVYSVQFPNGTDVKVDAMTGTVLGAETGQD
jgi:uncharacterized membrane protein YkoI